MAIDFVIPSEKTKEIFPRLIVHCLITAEQKIALIDYLNFYVEYHDLPKRKQALNLLFLDPKTMLGIQDNRRQEEYSIFTWCQYTERAIGEFLGLLSRRYEVCNNYRNDGQFDGKLQFLMKNLDLKPSQIFLLSKATISDWNNFDFQYEFNITVDFATFKRIWDHPRTTIFNQDSHVTVNNLLEASQKDIEIISSSRTFPDFFVSQKLTQMTREEYNDKRKSIDEAWKRLRGSPSSLSLSS